jgi:hypothetical protein
MSPPARHPVRRTSQSEDRVIDGVADNLEQLKPEQYVLAFVFLGSYAFALGEFIGPRGRRFAAGVAFAAAVGFAGFFESWELGVMIVALALVGMGAFAGLAWLLWRVGGRAESETQMMTETVLEEEVVSSPGPAVASSRKEGGVPDAAHATT